MKVISSDKFTKKNQASVKRALKNSVISDIDIINWMNMQNDIGIRRYDKHFTVTAMPNAPWNSKALNIRDAFRIAIQPFDMEIHS
ncbi:MAG: hypothetical protein ACUZ8I_05110 [Candidatus Scalindua sp.]